MWPEGQLLRDSGTGLKLMHLGRDGRGESVTPGRQHDSTEGAWAWGQAVLGSHFISTFKKVKNALSYKQQNPCCGGIPCLVLKGLYAESVGGATGTSVAPIHATGDPGSACQGLCHL